MPFALGLRDARHVIKANTAFNLMFNKYGMPRSLDIATRVSRPSMLERSTQRRGGVRKLGHVLQSLNNKKLELGKERVLGRFKFEPGADYTHNPNAVVFDTPRGGSPAGGPKRRSSLNAIDLSAVGLLPRDLNSEGAGMTGGDLEGGYDDSMYDSVTEESADRNEPKILEVSVKPVKWKHQPHFLIWFKDVTFMGNYEISKQANYSKTRWIKAITNHFYSPLLAVRTALRSLQEDERDSRKLTLINNAFNHVELLYMYIADLQDYFQLLYKRFRIRPKHFEIRDAIDRCLEMIRPRADEKSIKVQLKFHHPLRDDEVILNDPNRFQQVVLNLLCNAVQFNHEEGFIEVEVSEEGEKKIRVEISDSGIGIAPDDRERVFDAFNAIHGDDQSTEEGVGLGLWISRCICRQIGDDLQIDPWFKNGTKFIFLIDKDMNPSFEYSDSDQRNRTMIRTGSVAAPDNTLMLSSRSTNVSGLFQSTVIRPDMSSFEDDLLQGGFEMIESSEPPELKRMGSSNVNVAPFPKSPRCCSCTQALIVEADETIVRSLQDQLRKYGLKADFAQNGLNAKQTILTRRRENPCCELYQLVFISCSMRITKGPELIQELRKLRITKGPELIQELRKEIEAGILPKEVEGTLIGLIDERNPEERMQFRGIGLTAFLVKPIDTEELHELIIERKSKINLFLNQGLDEKIIISDDSSTF
eukprot:CAMPEP_0115027930 /NCGR_PEP_ID=MMETSP0216-20121206/35913_1 /TAXON_ID=223996 /ORGANISM="Protocruzia adherens, Strain Boccale" /LENGTH=699 /DNA_ID=CAMNT_0002403847 /DNA_START=91 /DNA_END=2190 /DNA_ORIENTATION=-